MSDINADLPPLDSQTAPDSSKTAAEQLSLTPKRVRKQSNYDRKVHGKRYPIANKLAIRALIADGVSKTEVAKLAGTSRQQVYDVLRDPELDDLAPKAVDAIKKGMTGLFYKRSLQSLLAMKAEKFDQSSLLQLATVAGIMTEKGRLMEEKSTANIGIKGIIQQHASHLDELQQKMAELEAPDNQAD